MRRLLLVALLIAVLSGCKAETTIGIDVRHNGSGEVSVQVLLDEEATRAVPDLKDKLAVDDLRARGWGIEGPTVDSGKTKLRVSHGFDTPEQAGELVAQLGAQDGPLKDFRIDQKRSLTNVRTSFTGTVDLTKGVESWGDPVLKERVGTALGFDPNEIKANLGVEPDTTFPVSVEVTLPGGKKTYSPDVEDGKWTLAYGTSHQLTETANGPNIRPLTYFGIAFVLLFFAILVLLIWKPYRPSHFK